MNEQAPVPHAAGTSDRIGWAEPGLNLASFRSLLTGTRRRVSKVMDLSRAYGLEREDLDNAKDWKHEALDSLALSREEEFIFASSMVHACALMITGKASYTKESLGWYDDGMQGDDPEGPFLAEAVLSSVRAAANLALSPEVEAAFGRFGRGLSERMLAPPQMGFHNKYEREVVAVLATMSDHMIARLPPETDTDWKENEGVPVSRLLQSVVSFPVAIYAEGHPGFPVVILSYNADTERCIGFPTDGFEPSAYYAWSQPWLRDGILPELRGLWIASEPAPGVLACAVDRFARGLAPSGIDERRKWAHAFGAKTLAERLNVTVPRLVAWLRTEGHVVFHEDWRLWIPSKAHERDGMALFQENLTNGQPEHRWTELFADLVATRRDDIAACKPLSGISLASQPPSETQMNLIAQISTEIGLAKPPIPRTLKGASKAIQRLMDRRTLSLAERALVAPPHADPGGIGSRLEPHYDDRALPRRFTGRAVALVAEAPPEGAVLVAHNGERMVVTRLGKAWVVQPEKRVRVGLPPGDATEVCYVYVMSAAESDM